MNGGFGVRRLAAAFQSGSPIANAGVPLLPHSMLVPAVRDCRTSGVALVDVDSARMKGLPCAGFRLAGSDVLREAFVHHVRAFHGIARRDPTGVVAASA